MGNKAKQKNKHNHLKQLKINRAKEKYNHGMMIINANKDKLDVESLMKIKKAKEQNKDISKEEGEN